MVKGVRTLGIIDSLSAGYRLIARRWWLVLIPILLDLFLWMGPQLSIAEVIQGLKGQLVAPAGMELSEEYQNTLKQMRQLMDQAAENANLLALLGAGIPGIPSLMAGSSPEATLLPLERPVVRLAGPVEAILWGITLLLAGTLLASLYVCWIGRVVLVERNKDQPRIAWPAHAFRTWVRVLLFILGILLLMLVIGVPIMLLVGMMMLLSQAVGILMLNLASIFLIWFGIWVAIYLYFVVDAIVLNHVNLLRAVWNSVNVVLRNFWATVGLIVLINVISAGMTLIWQRLMFASWSVLLGIVANAFIGTGLTAASLIFYLERFKRWQATRETSSLSVLFGGWGGRKPS